MNTQLQSSLSREIDTALSLALRRARTLLLRRRKGVEVEDFDIRGELYEIAMSAYPEARREERDFLLDWLVPKSGELGLDLASGNGFLSQAICRQTRSPILAFDSSREQLKNARKREPLLVPFCLKTDGCEMSRAIPDESLDFVASLGGIHHIEEQPQLFRNIFGLLKPGGRFVAADVAAGSCLSRHFDEVVDKKCLTGHSANWLSEQRVQELCLASGLRLQRMKMQRFSWHFPSATDAARFFRGLHAFPQSEAEILHDLEHTLGVLRDQATYSVFWPLLVFELRKA